MHAPRPAPARAPRHNMRTPINCQMCAFLQQLQVAGYDRVAIIQSSLNNASCCPRKTRKYIAADLTMSRLNISGFSDMLVDQLVDQLGLEYRGSANGSGPPSEDNETSDANHKRMVLHNFVQSHHEAERAVCRLALKQLGISMSSVRRLSRATHLLSASGAKNKEPLPSDLSAIPPQFSPVPWLPEHSWNAMTKHEKIEFMNYIFLSSCSHPRRILYDPHNFMMFGGSLDRVVIGHGPRHLLIIVGVHGNEPCGVEAAKLILQRQQVFIGDLKTTTADLRTYEDRWVSLEDLFDTLTIEFAVGNPKALECNQRYITKNLNRMFDILTLCDDKSAILHGHEYELQRARVLAESIRHSDIVLDVHSCSSDSPPFALPSSMEVSEELAACLPVQYVVESLVHRCLGGGTTLDCALLHGIPGVCVECGSHSK